MECLIFPKWPLKAYRGIIFSLVTVSLASMGSDVWNNQENIIVETLQQWIIQRSLYFCCKVYRDGDKSKRYLANKGGKLRLGLLEHICSQFNTDLHLQPNPWVTVGEKRNFIVAHAFTGNTLVSVNYHHHCSTTTTTPYHDGASKTVSHLAGCLTSMPPFRQTQITWT